MNRILVLAHRVSQDLRTDRELIAAVAANRDSEAIAELMRRHGPAARDVAADLCESNADEIVQTAFLLLMDRAKRLADRESAAGWLVHAARRLALKSRVAAHRRRNHEAKAASAEPASGPLDELLFREVRALVAEELLKLPDDVRVPLVLHYWEGAAHAEAAARFGCSIATLKRRLDLARERLGVRLARRGLTGAGILAALTTLHSEAAARTARVVPPIDLPPIPSLTGPGLVRGIKATGGTAKGLAIAACVFVAGIGLTYGLAAHPALSESAPPASNVDGPKPATAEDPRSDLPVGAIARMGSNAFHHGEAIERIAISADGRHMVSIGLDTGASKLWETETGRELPLAGGKLASLPGNGLVINTVALPKGLALLVSSDPKAAKRGSWMIDAVSGALLGELPLALEHTAVHPDGMGYATAALREVVPPNPQRRYAYSVEFQDLEKKKPPIILVKPQSRPVNRMVFSTDGRYLAIQYHGGTGIEILDMKSGAVALTIPDTETNGRPYDSFAFSPDSKFFAKEHRGDKSIRMWTMADAKELPAIPCNDGNWGHTLAFDSTGKRLGHLSAEGGVFRLYDVATGKSVGDIRCKGGFIGGFDALFTPDGKRLVTAEAEDLIIRDARTGKALERPGHHDNIYRMTWSRDGKRLVTTDGGQGTPRRVWDASTGRQVLSLTGHADGNLALATSPDGSLFATSGSRVKRDTGDVSVRLCSAVDGREIATLHPKLAASDLGIRQLWFSTDGKTLFGTARERLFVWDVEKKIETRSFAIPFNTVNSVHVIAGGKLLMSGWLPRPNSEFTSTSHPLVLATIDLEMGKEIGRREEFGQDGLAAVSPDGRFAIRMQLRSTPDHFADVWDLTTGRSVWRLNESVGKRDTPSVRCATFAADMRTVSIGL